MNSTTTQENQAPTQTATRRTVIPRHKVREVNDAYVVTALLPGVDRSTLETTVDGETLTVVGRRAFTAPADWTPVYRETPETDFRFVLELDQRINREGVKAELRQGVLTLTLPKAEAVKPRRIEIQD